MVVPGMYRICPPRASQTAAQIGVFPVQKEAFVEAADRIQCFSSRQHARPGNPVDDDTSVAGLHLGGVRMFCLANGDRGNRRVSRLERPNRPVNIVGSPLALPWIVPSGSTTLGPTTTQSGYRSSSACRTAIEPGNSSQSGLRISTSTPSVTASPWFTAWANPTFSVFRYVRRRLSSLLSSKLPSVEPLSITMQSQTTAARPSSSDDKQRRRSSAVL